MNNERLAKGALIAEIVGGIAVVISLVILIFEIRQNTQESQQNTQAIEISVYNDLIDNIMGINESVIEAVSYTHLTLPTIYSV